MQTVNVAPLIAPARRTLVVMGVSGCGKTEISQAVASELGWRLIEADGFHPSANVERMRAGVPLDDDDRREWLDLLAIEMQAAQAAGEGFVLACSALKRSYRERLRAAVPGLQFAYLAIDYPTALQRVGARPGHFMPISLVDNQFAILEAPDDEPQVLRVNAAQSRAELTAQICAWVRRDLVEQLTADATFEALADSSTSPEDVKHAPALTAGPIYVGGLARVFDRLSDGLMAALMAVMVAAVFGNVVLRYAFGTGWAGAEELSRLAFVWLVFVGVASSMRRGELMRFGMLRDRFPQVTKRLIDSLSWLLVTAASLLTAGGAWNQVQYGWGNSSTVLGYPLVLGMIPVLACMVVLAVLALVQLVNVWRRPQELAAAQANVTAD